MAKASRAQIREKLQNAQRLQGAQSMIHGAAIADKVGLNPIDLECLDLLQIYGPLPAGQLAARAGLRTATVTTILDRLEKAGFIRRDRGGEDRRVVLIHVQAKAFQIIGPHYRYIGTHLAAVEEQYTVDELALIARFTEQAAAAVAAAIEDLRRSS